MEAKLKDIDNINREVRLLKAYANTIVENTRRLNLINRRQYILDPSLILELTFYKNGGRDKILDHYTKLNPYADIREIDARLQCLSNNREMSKILPILEGLEPLSLINTSRDSVIAGRPLKRNDFIMESDKVTYNEKTIEEIENYYTYAAKGKSVKEFNSALSELRDSIKKLEKLYAKHGMYFHPADLIREIQLPGSSEFELDTEHIAQLMWPMFEGK